MTLELRRKLVAPWNACEVDMDPNKPESPHQNCRESRPVPFYPKGEIWSAVHDGVIRSVDVDSNKQFNPPLSPESQVAFQKQSPPQLPRVASQARLPQRRPMVAIADPNVQVLAAELRKVESEVVSLKKHIKTQDQLIRGFCQLHVQKEN